MKRDIKWMLLGIFLGVAACWCLTVGAGSVFFLVLGFYVLPVVAVIVFATGFTGVDGPKFRESNEYPGDPEDTEPKEKSE